MIILDEEIMIFFLINPHKDNDFGMKFIIRTGDFL